MGSHLLSLVPTGRMKTCKKESFLQLADYKFQGACCDHLQVRSSDEDFPYGNCLGSFDLYTDIEDEPVVSYGASCFKHTTDKTYLYRTKYGHWCIGTVLGKFKRGALMRSCEKDEEDHSYVIVSRVMGTWIPIYAWCCRIINIRY